MQISSLPEKMIQQSSDSQTGCIGISIMGKLSIRTDTGMILEQLLEKEMAEHELSEFNILLKKMEKVLAF